MHVLQLKYRAVGATTAATAMAVLVLRAVNQIHAQTSTLYHVIRRLWSAVSITSIVESLVSFLQLSLLNRCSIGL